MEFALLFPLLTALFLATFNFVLLAVRQFRLEHEAGELVRELAMDCLSDSALLEQTSRRRLSEKYSDPPEVMVAIRRHALAPAEAPFENPNILQVLDVTLVQGPLRSQALEACRAPGK